MVPIILLISVTFVAGKPLSSACRWIIPSSFRQIHAERLVSGNKVVVKVRWILFSEGVVIPDIESSISSFEDQIERCLRSPAELAEPRARDDGAEARLSGLCSERHSSLLR